MTPHGSTAIAILLLILFVLLAGGCIDARHGIDRDCDVSDDLVDAVAITAGLVGVRVLRDECHR